MRIMSSLTSRQSTNRDDEQLPFVFDRGVQRQADEQREERIGVEVLHVARAERGVEQVRDGQDACERRADALHTRRGRPGPPPSAQDAGLHGQQGRRDRARSNTAGRASSKMNDVWSPKRLPARDRDERVLEPGEQPGALVEDADVERRGAVAVVDLDRSGGGSTRSRAKTPAATTMWGQLSASQSRAGRAESPTARSRSRTGIVAVVGGLVVEAAYSPYSPIVPRDRGPRSPVVDAARRRFRGR